MDILARVTASLAVLCFVLFIVITEYKMLSVALKADVSDVFGCSVWLIAVGIALVSIGLVVVVLSAIWS